MVCYIVRHGKDDESIRGGWSNHGLVPEGRKQVNELGVEMLKMDLHISEIYSSDIQRAKETAELLQTYLCCPLEYVSEFREVNNGHLAGMKNELALEKYPGVYWSTLDYTECYPGGESPEQFFQRILTAWTEFKKRIMSKNENVLLVTHGGVLEAILCIENGVRFTNKEKQFKTPGGKLFPITIE